MSDLDSAAFAFPPFVFAFSLFGENNSNYLVKVAVETTL
jgi:hypothetical protein